MNWEAISSFAEVVGAGAVVISLIYVGVQIKLNNSLYPANTFQQINFQFAEVASQLSSDAELARIYRIAAEGGDLDPDEAIRYTAYLTSFFTSSGSPVATVVFSNLTFFFSPSLLIM